MCRENQASEAVAVYTERLNKTTNRMDQIDVLGGVRDKTPTGGCARVRSE